MYKTLAYLFTLLLLTSCGKEISENTDARSVFRMNLPEGCTSLDPAFARGQSVIWMTSQLFNGLVELDENLKVRPSISQDWNISKDGLSYTFHLRNDIVFHKSPLFGKDSTRKVVADDIAYSFTRICDPKWSSNGFWIFNGKVSGIEEYRAGNADHIAGFEVVDDSTFIIHLTQPLPQFMGLLAMPYAYIVPQEVCERYQRDFRSHPIGTGPFKLKSWKEGQSLILLKNTAYFEVEKGERLPYLDAVYVRFIESELSAFVEFTQNRLDFINNLDNSFKDEIMAPGGTIKPEFSSKYQFTSTPQLNTEFLAFLVDSTQEVVQNHPIMMKKVRQALNYAIDREKLVKYLLNGNGFPAHAGIVPMGMPGFDADSVVGYRYDPEKAARLLAESGFPDGKGFPVLSLKSTPKYQPVMEFVQKSFENIGIRMEIDNMNGSTLRGQASKAQINFWRASWIADYADPENYLSLFYSPNIPPNGANRMRYSSTTFDSLYQVSLGITDFQQRVPLYQEMDRMVMEDASIIPLYYDRIFRILQPGIEGMETNGMNFLYLKRVRK